MITVSFFGVYGPQHVYEKTDTALHTQSFPTQGMIVIYNEDSPLIAMTLAKAEDLAEQITTQSNYMRNLPPTEDNTP